MGEGRPVSFSELGSQVVPAHNELDRWSVPRDGMNLEQRIRWLGQAYSEALRHARDLEAARDLHVPDFPPSASGESS